MEVLNASGELVEDTKSSRVYAGILNCVQLVLSDIKGSIAEHVAGLVTTLRPFFVYGLGNGRPAVSTMPIVHERLDEANGKMDSDKAVYRPPHLRRSLNKNPSHISQNGIARSSLASEAGNKISLSDSEQSDSDGSVGDGDRFKSAKARASAIRCIQALARTDPKALHAHWMLLLPTYDVFNLRRSQATLLNALLFDPFLKVRMVAASTICAMLEGPSRSFMQVAEYKESGKFGSFMTLSCSLGQILLQLQRGLAYLVLNECNIGLLVASLKALSLFVAAAPFSRLPDNLLPATIDAVQKRMKDLFCSSTDQTSVVCMALGVLGCALNTAPASKDVARVLSNEVSGIKSECQLLHYLLLCAQPHMPSLVRVEALQALRFGIHNYPSVMVLYGVPISSIVQKSIQSSPKEQPICASSTRLTALAGVSQIAQDEKAVYAAVKLLDEFLRAASGSKYDESLDETGLKSSLALSTGIGSFSPLDNTQEYERNNQAAGISHWDESLQDYLPLLIKHSADLVRGGAITCFAGLTNAVFCDLPDRMQDYIRTIVLITAVQDEAPSVRSAACRAIGVLISFPILVARDDFLKAAMDVIILSTSDVAITVRITASWALANICDALRSAAESESVCSVSSTALTDLAECAIKLSKEGDKVRANAVRALGNLARFVSFSGQDAVNSQPYTCDSMCAESRVLKQGIPETYPWLERMVHTLVSCVTTGNVKVQWNVCHALGNLFLNKSLALPKVTWAVSVFSILLLLLRGSANFKIRIQAASALAVPTSRQDYGESFHDVIQALVLALDSLESSYQVLDPSSFKYMNVLTEQLTASSLHVLELATPYDYDILQDFLLKRRTFLEAWLKSTYYSAVRIAASVCQGMETQALEENSNCHSSRCSMHNEKLLPPPKARIRYALNSEDATCSEESSSLRKASIRRVVEKLIELYRYGNQAKVVLVFEQLLTEFPA